MGNLAKSGAASRHLQFGRLSPWESGPEGLDGLQKLGSKHANKNWLQKCHIFQLLGGLEHDFYDFPYIYNIYLRKPAEGLGWV